MGGGQQASQTTQSYNLPSWMTQAGQGAFNAVQSGTNQLASQIPQAQAGMQTNFSQFNPQQQMQQFNPVDAMQQQGLTPFFQQMASQGQQQSAQQAAAQQANINRQFQSQPGTANILGQQAQMNAMLQQNPLLSQAAQAQMQQQNAQNQMGLQSTQANNQATLAAAQQGMGAQQAGNSAIAQQLGLGMLPMQAQQNLLQTLSAMAPIFGIGVGQTKPMGEDKSLMGNILTPWKMFGLGQNTDAKTGFLQSGGLGPWGQLGQAIFK